MLDLSRYPRCAFRLEHQRSNLKDPAMNEYWAAVELASGYSNETLEDFGGFDFEDRSPANGKALLARFEEMMLRDSQRRKKQQEDRRGKEMMMSLNAFLGVFGVKTSKLKTDADYWRAGLALWPTMEAKEGPLETLHRQIRMMSKRQRVLLAGENVKNIPMEFRSVAPKAHKPAARKKRKAA